MLLNTNTNFVVSVRHVIDLQCHCLSVNGNSYSRHAKQFQFLNFVAHSPENGR